MGEWTLFSNHGHVLVCLANNSEARLRDVSAAVGITERAVQNILRELQDSGLVQVSKHGRCNHYQINHRKPLRHPLEAHCTVGTLLQMLKAANANTSGDDAAIPQAVETKIRKPPRPTSKAKPEFSEPPEVAVSLVTTQPAIEVPLTPNRAETVSAAPKAATVRPDTDKKAKQRKSDSPAPGDQQGSLF